MKNIVLIGPPGSGKSTVGRALARVLKMDLVDTDTLVERNHGKKITEIFVDEGEAEFRKLESVAVAQTLLSDGQIISLGGGAPISPEAQKVITDSNSVIVFLDVSLASAAPRVGFNRDRPLLLGNPRAQWQALYDVRRPIYEKLATIAIKVDGLTVDQVVSKIRAGL